MGRRFKMCEECPFRGQDEQYKRECAEIPADWFACHMDAGWNGDDDAPQCRGHYEARRKYATSVTSKESVPPTHAASPVPDDTGPVARR